MGLFQVIWTRSGMAGDAHWRRFVARWSLVSLLLIAVAAYNSYGFFQFDEHYQVVELVGYKLGKTPASELAWEFHSQIRPWLQPSVYYVVAKTLTAAGVENPFSLSMAFRAVSGLFGWLAITALMLSANVVFGPGRSRRLAVALLATLWLLPYLAVRTSSESLASDFFAFGCAALLLGSTFPARPLAGPERTSLAASLIAGVCFGLAFEFRFQIAFAVMGAMGWILFCGGDQLSRRLGSLSLITVGVALAVLLGTAVDRWGYGEWTCVPWNYFHKDIIEGRPNLDGTEPPWAYLLKVALNPLAPITWLWIAAMVVVWIRFPRHIVTWGTLPFFIVHSLVPHKEVRYLFPMALLGVFAIVLAMAPGKGRRRPAWLGAAWRARRSLGAKALIGFNAAALCYSCLVAKEPSLNFQHFVVDHYPRGCTLYVLGDQTRSPYENVGATMFFYRTPGFRVMRVSDESELAEQLAEANGDCLVVRDRLNPWDGAEQLSANVQLIYRTYPAWVEQFNWFNWLSNSKRFSLYAVHPRAGGTLADKELSQDGRMASRTDSHSQ